MTVGTFATQRRCDSSKTMTITRMATLTRLIPVNVDAFDTHRIYRRACFWNAGSSFFRSAGPSSFLLEIDRKMRPNAVIYNICSLS